eukprot:Rmarinus@m.23674
MVARHLLWVDMVVPMVVVHTAVHTGPAPTAARTATSAPAPQQWKIPTQAPTQALQKGRAPPMLKSLEPPMVLVTCLTPAAAGVRLLRRRASSAGTYHLNPRRTRGPRAPACLPLPLRPRLQPAAHSPWSEPRREAMKALKTLPPPLLSVLAVVAIRPHPLMTRQVVLEPRRPWEPRRQALPPWDPRLVGAPSPMRMGKVSASALVFPLCLLVQNLQLLGRKTSLPKRTASVRVGATWTRSTQTPRRTGRS